MPEPSHIVATKQIASLYGQSAWREFYNFRRFWIGDVTRQEALDICENILKRAEGERLDINIGIGSETMPMNDSEIAAADAILADLVSASKAFAAVSRLSPAVRELLITNPEAVERSVQAVMSHDPDDVAATMNAFAELSPIIREMMLDNMSEFRRMVDKAYGERLAAEMIASLYEKDSAALKPGRDEGDE